MVPGRARAVALAALALGGASCSDLTRYSTGPGEQYKGCIVAADFLRRGFGTDTGMSMTLHVHQISCPASGSCLEGPGLVTTNDGLFAGTPLDPIETLPHDALWDVSFGADRVKNYLFGLRLPGTPGTGPLAGRDATVFVSLMKDDSVEVRIVLGRNDLFGIFRLRRTADPANPNCPAL